MHVTFYKHFHQNEGDFYLQQVLDGIGNGQWKDSVEAHRAALASGDMEKAERLKKGLPAFTLSATYKGRRKIENLTMYNQVILLDIDKLKEEEIEPLKEKIRKIPYTRFCFRSPGKNGLKIGVWPVVGHLLTVENHRVTFKMVASFYEAKLKVAVDPSGKDIGRLCFVSYDPNMYISPDIGKEIFLPVMFPEEKAAELLLPETNMQPAFAGEGLSDNETDSLLKKARKRTSAKHIYSEGNRNNYVYHFAHHCRALGVDRKAVYAYVRRKFTALHESELIPTIDSAYNAAPLIDNQSETKEESRKRTKEERCRQEIEEMERFLCNLYLFRYNEVIHRVEYRLKSSDAPFIPLDDSMENTIWCNLRRAGIGCTQKTLHALLRSEFSVQFNPFVAYFESLPLWDGTTDAIEILADTVQTTNQELWRRCLKKWIVAMVACSLYPDVQNHTVLVLSSTQGKGKTSWCLNLVPPELRGYRYSGIPNPQSRDAMLALSECILMNFDELGTITIKELNKLKELITKGVIRDRRAYGENIENYIRRASFTASVNSNQVLSDLTGSRRFLCFETTSIDYQRPVDYTSVFSQAKTLLEQGYRYWLGDDEIDEIQENNELFRARSPEEEFFHIWYRKPTPEDKNVQSLTAAQILEVLCFKTHLQMSHSGVIKIGMILKREEYKLIRRSGRSCYLVVQRSNEEVGDEKSIDS